MKEPIYVKRSRYGRGVFASRDIKKGEKICIMAGEKIRASMLNKVTDSGRNILVDPLQIDDNTFINMRSPYVLINHSCKPNAGLRKGDVLFAISDIRKNDEILYDYSTVWFEAFRCKCGNRKCRKWIGSFMTMQRTSQKKYIRLDIVPDFIKSKIRK